MSKISDRYFFDNFVECMTYSCEAAEFLKSALKRFDIQSLPKQLEQMHEIEHKADKCKHHLTKSVTKAFITPIERDDILDLSQNVDNVTDSIEDILIHIYITNITEIRSDALDFANLLISCCEETKEALVEFSNFKKSKKLNDLLIKINNLEEEGDAMYIRAMHSLHKTEKDPLNIIAWRKIYDLFEKCCDLCEDLANIIESIVIGNT